MAHCAGEGSGWRLGMGHHQRSLGAQPSEATGHVGTSFYISPGVRPLLVLLLQAETMGAGYAHLPFEVFVKHSGLDRLATAKIRRSDGVAEIRDGWARYDERTGRLLRPTVNAAAPSCGMSAALLLPRKRLQWTPRCCR